MGDGHNYEMSYFDLTAKPFTVGIATCFDAFVHVPRIFEFSFCINIIFHNNDHAKHLPSQTTGSLAAVVQ